MDDVKSLCRQKAKFYHVDRDEVFEKAIDFLIEFGKHWMDKYDPKHESCSSLNTYMLVNLEYKLRCFKRKKKKRIKEQSLDDQMAREMLYTDREALANDLRENIAIVLKQGATQYEQWLILSYTVYKLSFREVADRMGVSKGTIRLQYIRAIHKCQKVEF
jgi:RNA polymerase sigma factor (sigma-70 family)